MRVNGNKLAELYGVDRRTVTNWINSDPPCPSEVEGRERVFSTPEVARWYADTAVKRALAEKEKQKPVDLSEIKQRKEIAETRIAEIELATLEGKLIATEVHKEVVGEVCDRLRAALINIPSNFTLHLEKLGVSSQDSQTVLEEIADALTAATRQVGDEIEADDGDD